MRQTVLKTTSKMVIGNYWNIEVEGINGFGVCLAIRSRVIVLAGILNYTSIIPVLTYGKYDVIDVGDLHIKSIAHHNGQIRGVIPVPDYSNITNISRTYGYGVPGILVRNILARG